MMRKISRIITVSLLAALLILCLAIPSVAASEQDDCGHAEVDAVVLNVGADETERNLSWYSIRSGAGAVQYAPAADMVDGEFPTNYKSASSTYKRAANDYSCFANKATMSGLKENTEYVYRIVHTDYTSELYYFNTGSFGDFEFVFVGDPQFGTEQWRTEWSDTLGKIDASFNAELVVSAGDQINTPSSEEQYSLFIVDELTSLAFAATVGPVHDDPSETFSDHFNLPNLSDGYGVSTSGADYWYTWGDVLFMHLNMADSSALQSEHKIFMEETIDKNPDATWKIVVLHTALFTTGMHSSPDYSYYESEIGKYRATLAPQLTELGIDLVLSGHDHIYVRSHMMNGVEVSDDVVTNNSVTDPEGTLHICASSSTGSKFYDSQIEDAYYAAYENDTRRKSAVHFKVTDDFISMKAYFLDDMTVFDNFTIYKTPHTHAPVKTDAKAPSCTENGNNEYWVCDICEGCFKDEACTQYTTPRNELIAATGHNYSTATCTEPAACQNEGCESIKTKARGHKFSNICDTDCNRTGCDYTREVNNHIDKNGDLACEFCEYSFAPTVFATCAHAGAITISAFLPNVYTPLYLTAICLSGLA